MTGVNCPKCHQTYVGTHDCPEEPLTMPLFLRSDVQEQDENDRQAHVLARQFHEAYERLAPQHNYQTREETREFDPSSSNGRLMVAVCAELLHTRAIDATLVNAVARRFPRWRRQTEKPTERLTTAIVAIRSDDDPNEWFLLTDKYDWKDGQWWVEGTRRPLDRLEYRWLPEAELLAGVPY